MLYLVIKAAISGVLIAVASEVARRYPGWGALVASLPLVSILGMMWLVSKPLPFEAFADALGTPRVAA